MLISGGLFVLFYLFSNNKHHSNLFIHSEHMQSEDHEIKITGILFCDIKAWQITTALMFAQNSKVLKLPQNQMNLEILHYLSWGICDNAHSSLKNSAEGCLWFCTTHLSHSVETRGVKGLSKWWRGQEKMCS